MSSVTTTNTSGNWVLAATQLPHSFSTPSTLSVQAIVSIRKPSKQSINTHIYCALQSSPSLLNFTTTTTKTTKKALSYPPQWNLFKQAAITPLDMVEATLVNRERAHPLPRTADPRVQIAGNFAPVPEQPVQHALPVAGTIPECIDGVYVWNGANPLFEPIAGHHLFDGDGMVHAIRIHNGCASYACRFTETRRLAQERELGRPIFPKAFGELHGHSGIARLALFYARGFFGLVDATNGIGVANAGLVCFNGRLLAMSEDDIPYNVRVTPAGDLKTVGPFNFEGQLNSSIIAHPKLDPITKELFALSYDVIKKPYLKLFKFLASREKSPEVEIPVKSPSMMHDFAITENFVVIPDQQVVFKLQEMVRGGSPVVHDKDKTTRYGVLPKGAKDATNIIWVECPDTFCFHIWNVWEEVENDEIVVIGSCMTPADYIYTTKKVTCTNRSLVTDKISIGKNEYLRQIISSVGTNFWNAY